MTIRSNRGDYRAGNVVLGAAVFLVSGAIYLLGTLRVVPPQVDHDLEVQATVYSLLTRGQPMLLTDRHTTWYFAHPPLLHILVATSFVAAGSVDDLKIYDDATQRAKAAIEGREFIPLLGDTVRLDRRADPYLTTAFDSGRYVLAPLAGGAPMRATVEQVELGRIYDAYERKPHLVATRLPNIILAALTVTLLGLWVSRISGRWFFGALVAAAYATSPEVFVRSSYGGYFAIGAFMAILMLLAVERWSAWPGWRRAILPVSVGALAALSDHKLVLFPLSVALWMVFVAWRTRESTVTNAVRHAVNQPIVVGFFLGTVLYWAYGLAIAPQAFWTDHVRSHLLDRITHVNPLGYGGYASPIGLWSEFAKHTGWIVLPAALAFLVLDLRARSGSQVPKRGLWLTWIVLTAFTFTLIDWRMTKHLMPIVLPLFLAFAPTPDAVPWRRYVPAALLSVVIVWNCVTIAGIANDFSSFQVTPAW